jgi:hypothetical protein
VLFVAIFDPERIAICGRQQLHTTADTRCRAVPGVQAPLKKSCRGVSAVRQVDGRKVVERSGATRATPKKSGAVQVFRMELAGQLSNLSELLRAVLDLAA